MISQPSAKMAGSQLLYVSVFSLFPSTLQEWNQSSKLFHVSLMTAFDVISTVYQLYRGPQSLLMTLRPSLQPSSPQGQLEHFWLHLSGAAHCLSFCKMDNLGPKKSRLHCVEDHVW